MTTTGQRINGNRSGRLNTKQFKIWMDLLAEERPISVPTLADRHNYTNREVTTAIGRMLSPPVMFDEGMVWFEGRPEEREYYRRVLTADRFRISDELCDRVYSALTDEWRTVTMIAAGVGLPTVLVSHTLVVIGDRIDKKSSSGGVYYKIRSEPPSDPGTA